MTLCNPIHKLTFNFNFLTFILYILNLEEFNFGFSSFITAAQHLALLLHHALGNSWNYLIVEI